MLKKKITAVLPQLRSQKRDLWQVLTWDEGATLLSSPDLMSWLSSALMPTAHPRRDQCCLLAPRTVGCCRPDRCR